MSDNIEIEYYNETINYYQQNKEKLKKYNREYYKRRQQSDKPLYINGEGKKSVYISGDKIMCEKCGSVVRTRWINFHQESKSCKYPHTVPLKKRYLINLKDKIDSDDDEYFKL